MNITVMIAAGLFSPAQIAGIVIICVLMAGVIALNVFLIVLLNKRGAHKMQTRQLQLQRNALMKKLDAMRSGVIAANSPIEETADYDGEDSEESSIEVEEFVDEQEEEPTEIVVTETGTVVRYNRSFTARITQADGDLKARYSELKNFILAYSGVRSRMSWRKETFSVGRKSLASFIVRGKTLCLCLATDPALFDGTKYKVDDVSGRNKKNTMPCLFRIKSDRRMAYAKELTEIVMAGFGLQKKQDYKATDYTLPYKSTEVLIKRKLIKISSGVRDFEKDEALAAARGIRYNRSFEARIMQADDALKFNYSKLKNYITTYNDVAASFTWKNETFKYAKTCVAMFVIRGKTLCLCLAADPEKYENTKYKVEDLSRRNKKTVTPLMYRIKNDRRINYAMQLIDGVFAEHGLIKGDPKNINYAVPFTSTDTLVRRGLIRVVTASLSQAGRFSRPAVFPVETANAPSGEIPLTDKTPPAHEAEAAATESKTTESASKKPVVPETSTAELAGRNKPAEVPTPVLTTATPKED